MKKILNLINDTIKYVWKYKMLLFLCIFIYAVTLIRIIFDGGMGCINGSCGFIIGENSRDGIWFMSVAATAFKSFPFQIPVFSGTPLQGYYYFPALIVYIISKVGVPITIFCYKIFPWLYLFSMTVILVTLGRKIKDNPLFVFFLLFFTLLGIPLTIAPALIHSLPIQNRLLINTFQANNIFDSFPTAFSYLLFFPGIILAIKEKKMVRDYILISILLFFLFGTKFYTAFLFLFIVSIYEVIRVVQNKQTIRSALFHVGLFLLFTFSSILVFLDPIHTTKGVSMFTFAPFATVHHLIEEPTLFYLKNMTLARYYLYQFGMTPRLLAIELFSTLLFIVFYFGIRIIGFIYLAKRYIFRKATDIEISVGISMVLCILLSVLLIQRGDWFNPIQFAVGVAHLLSIYAALLCYEMYKHNKKFFYGVFIIVILCTIPSNMVNLGYLNVDRHVISMNEMKAINFLKAQKDGPVFVPIDEDDSPYIPLLTGKTTYYNFIHVLESFGIDATKRKNQVSDFKKIIVDELEIKYAYLPTGFNKFGLLYKKFNSSKKYRLIFRNIDIAIFMKI